MGYCTYQFNASELYRRTKPGTAPEVVCGARTFPAADEPEIVVVQTGMGPDGAIYDYVRTGRFTTRAADDPYCPAHGGSAPPPPPPVTVAELEYAYTAYQELAARFAAQPGGALAAPAQPAPAALEAAQAPPDGGLAPAPPAPAADQAVSAEQVAAARAALARLIDRAEQEGAAR